MVAGDASDARQGKRAGERGGEGGGAHQESIPMVDLGGGGPEKRNDAKRLSSSGAPMVVGGRAVDSGRRKLERGSWRCGTRLGRLSRKKMDERRLKMAGAVRAVALLEVGLKGGARAE